MRITSIELAGTSETTLHDGSPGLPGAFARICRTQGDDHITVELLTPGNERSHEVQADDRDDQWSMAQILQHAAQGVLIFGRLPVRRLRLLQDLQGALRIALCTHLSDLFQIAFSHDCRLP